MSIEVTLLDILAEARKNNQLLAAWLTSQTVDLVSLAEASLKLNVSIATLKRRLADGTLTRHQDGRILRVSLSELRDKLKGAAK